MNVTADFAGIITSLGRSEELTSIDNTSRTTRQFTGESSKGCVENSNVAVGSHPYKSEDMPQSSVKNVKKLSKIVTFLMEILTFRRYVRAHFFDGVLTPFPLRLGGASFEFGSDGLRQPFGERARG